AAGYRWYETANFCRRSEDARGRDLRARHNLAYWLGRDYLGVGIGAVSTIDGERWRNTPRLRDYERALASGQPPPRELERLHADSRLKVPANERRRVRAHSETAGDSRPCRPGLHRDRPAGRLEASRGGGRPEGFPVDGSKRACGARGAWATDAPAHFCRASAD